jgi:mitogen-activated protein kinase organizer 1
VSTLLVWSSGYLCRCRSHDNSKFASSGGDRSVFLWDVATGVTTRRLSGHMGKIYSVEFNADASVVASGELLSFYLSPLLIPNLGSFDSSVRLWDLRYAAKSMVLIKSPHQLLK